MVAAVPENNFMYRLEQMSSWTAAWKLPAKVIQTSAEWASYVTPWKVECQALSGRVKEIAAPLALPMFLEKLLKFKKGVEKVLNPDPLHPIEAGEAASTLIAGGAECIDKGASFIAWLQKAQFVFFAASYLTTLKVISACAGLVSKSAKMVDAAWGVLANDGSVNGVSFAKAALEFTLAVLTLLTLFSSLEIQLLVLALGTVSMGFDWFAS